MVEFLKYSPKRRTLWTRRFTSDSPPQIVKHSGVDEIIVGQRRHYLSDYRNGDWTGWSRKLRTLQFGDPFAVRQITVDLQRLRRLQPFLVAERRRVVAEDWQTRRLWVQDLKTLEAAIAERVKAWIQSGGAEEYL